MGHDQDFFRDTKVRYLGYANEVGEAFRPVVSRRLVNLSYKIAFAYILCDTADKSLKSLWRDGSLLGMAVGTGDALIWQSLASIAIPGLTINRVVYYTGRALRGRPVTPVVQRFAPVAVGLACIPLIVTPIDRAVDTFMNLSYRILRALLFTKRVPPVVKRSPPLLHSTILTPASPSQTTPSPPDDLQAPSLNMPQV